MAYHILKLGNKLGTIENWKLAQLPPGITEFRRNINSVLKIFIERSNPEELSLKSKAIIVSQINQLASINMDSYLIQYCEQLRRGIHDFYEDIKYTSDSNNVIFFLSKIFIFCKNF